MEYYKNPLVESWGKRVKELRSQPEDKRDKHAYYKNLLWTFRHDLGIQCAFRFFLLFTELY